MAARPHTSAVDVARYLVLLAAKQEEPDALTPLRLQKLLYYVQGWAIATNGGPLFKEDMQAWAHGPVVPEVWRKFSGNAAIPEEEGAAENLSDEECDFIRRVWEAYRGFAAWSLREMTHSEKPWKRARKGIADGAACSRAISLEDMREHFKKLATSS